MPASKTIRVLASITALWSGIVTSALPALADKPAMMAQMALPAVEAQPAPPATEAQPAPADASAMEAQPVQIDKSQSIDFDHVSPGPVQLTGQLHNSGVDFEGACLLALPGDNFPATARDGQFAVVPCAANPASMAALSIVARRYPIVLHFEPAIHQIGLWVRAAANLRQSPNITMTALDAGGATLASKALTIPEGSIEYYQLPLSTKKDAIASVVVSSDLPGQAIVVDDLSFDWFVAPPPTPPPPPPPHCVYRNVFQQLLASLDRGAMPTCPGADTRYSFLLVLVIAGIGALWLFRARRPPAQPERHAPDMRNTGRLTTRTVDNGLGAMTVSVGPDDAPHFDVSYVVKCDARPESGSTKITISGAGGNDGS